MNDKLQRGLTRLCTIAESFLGIPYLWGGQNPLEGFDCSGLVLTILRTGGELTGQDLTAQGIFQELSRSGAKSSQAQRGAVAFFGTGVMGISHVAFITDTEWMIEAFGDKTISGFEAAKNYRNHTGAFVKYSMVARRKDVVGILMPAYTALQ